MLKQRILTALVLVPILLGALFYLPAAGVALMFAVIIAIGAWEWGGLVSLSRPARAIYTAVIVVLGAAAVSALLTRANLSWARWVLGAAVLFWVWALYALIANRSAGREWQITRAGKLASGLLVLVPAWFAAIYLLVVDGQRPALLLYTLLLVWVADTFAYFAGHRWGKHKLAPKVSPGKTIEGVVGGFAGALVFAVIAGLYVWHWQGSALFAWMALAATTMLMSVLGDLVESLHKRMAGVKDSGTILPGHGGVLDRIDALTSALPVFALGWFYMQRSLS
jgi:phosphatidate cytidylyltransferase